MPRILAWGCNVTGSLDPAAGTNDDITSARDVTEILKVDEILWTGWPCSIGRTPSGIRVWGMSALIDNGGRSQGLDIDSMKRILGFDEPVGYLDDQGFMRDFTGHQSTTQWNDACVTGTGTVYAFNRGAGISVFPSLQAVFDSEDAFNPTHPAFSPAHSARLYSNETRAFLHSQGSLQQLFEIVTQDKNGECEPTLELIQDLEGMTFDVIPGSRNRVGIVTDTGSGYILDAKSQELEEIEAPGDVRLLGVGAGFDVVVVGDEVYTRGDNRFGQLGLGTFVPESAGEDEVNGDSAEWHVVPISGKVTDVKCSRWGTFLTVDDAS